MVQMIVGSDVMENRIPTSGPTPLRTPPTFTAKLWRAGRCCAIPTPSAGHRPSSATRTPRSATMVATLWGGGVRPHRRHLADVYDRPTIGINQVRANMGMGYSDEHNRRAPVEAHLCPAGGAGARQVSRKPSSSPAREKPVPIGNTVFVPRSARIRSAHQAHRPLGGSSMERDRGTRLRHRPARRNQPAGDQDPGGQEKRRLVLPPGPARRRCWRTQGARHRRFQKLREDESLRQTIVSEAIWRASRTSPGRWL